MPIGLTWDNERGVAKLARTTGGALGEDESLETVVLLALFTDAPATAAEIEAGTLAGPQGRRADANSLRGSRAPYGSKLWLLTRGTTTLATLVRAEQYAVEALQYLVTKKIAASVTVRATRPSAGQIALDIRIARPNKLLPPFVRLWTLRSAAA